MMALADVAREQRTYVRRVHPAIAGLRRAEIENSPPSLPSTKPNSNLGSKLGQSFERSFGKGLAYALKDLRQQKQLAGELYSGVWIRFEDARGPGGLVQIDHFIVFPTGIVVFECKLRECDEAYPQLMRYAPLLEHIFARPVRMVAVFKILRGTTKLPLQVFSLWDCLVEGPALRYWHVPHRDYVVATTRVPRKTIQAENPDGR